MSHAKCENFVAKQTTLSWYSLESMQSIHVLQPIHFEFGYNDSDQNKRKKMQLSDTLHH